MTNILLLETGLLHFVGRCEYLLAFSSQLLFTLAEVRKRRQFNGVEARLTKTLLFTITFVISLYTSQGQGTTATAGSTASSTAFIKQEAQNCGRAVLTSDFQSIVRYTHPRIVKKLGGKDAMMSILKTGVAQMKAIGTAIVDVSIGQPEAPKKFGTWTTSIVPQHLVIKVSGGKLYCESTLLGISEDGGKHWVFVDLGQMGKDEFKLLFPELNGKIVIPEAKAPKFVKDPASAASVPSKQSPTNSKQTKPKQR